MPAREEDEGAEQRRDGEKRRKELREVRGHEDGRPGRAERRAGVHAREVAKEEPRCPALLRADRLERTPLGELRDRRGRGRETGSVSVGARGF